MFSQFAVQFFALYKFFCKNLRKTRRKFSMDPICNIVIFDIFNPIILRNTTLIALILFIPPLLILKLFFSLFCKSRIHHFQIIFHFMIFTDERVLRNAPA